MPCIMDQKEVLAHMNRSDVLKMFEQVPDDNGSIGVDAKITLNDNPTEIVYCEAIGFTLKEKEAPHGKNQSDLWKGFSQAISRPNDLDKEGCAVAMPIFYLLGWKQRCEKIKKDAWERIGNAFPKLYLIFVHNEKRIIIKKWNDAYDAHNEISEDLRGELSWEKSSRFADAKRRIEEDKRKNA